MAGRGAAPGERRGGRQKGTLNKAKQKVRARAPATATPGMMPAGILLDIARYHHNRAVELRKQSKAITKKARSPEDQANLPVVASTIEVEIRSEHAMAVSAADKAASYYHPKLATLQSNVNLEGRLTIADLVNQSYAAPKAANENKDAPSVDEKPDAANK